MTDFFDDLERQLVDATTQRRARIRRARQRRAAMLSTILIALIAGGAGIAAAVGGSGDGTQSGMPAGTGTTADRVPATEQTVPSVAAAEHAQIVVSVLNGTAVPGLARGVANRLQNAHFKIGNVTNAADQTRAQTVVFYAPGHRRQAAAVGKVLGGGRYPAVQPADRGSRVIVGNQADVIVVVGSDQNISPSP